MSAADRDSDVLSIPEAARLAGYTDSSFRARLAEAPEFSNAVLISFGEKARKTVSLPRLCRHLHGAEADVLIPEWRERVTSWRSASERKAS
jgi:hypothetical protein